MRGGLEGVLTQALVQHAPQRLITPVGHRTGHTYTSALRMLCQAIRLDVDARDFRCEQRLVEEAHRINNAGEMLAPVIHDAHLIGVHDRLQRN